MVLQHDDDHGMPVGWDGLGDESGTEKAKGDEETKSFHGVPSWRRFSFLAHCLRDLP